MDIGGAISNWRRRRTCLPMLTVRPTVIARRHNYVEPNPDYQALVFNALKEEVAVATFGISPLQDAVYLYRIDVKPQHRRKGYAVGFLVWLSEEYNLPITPVHIVGSANSFWHAARQLGVGNLIVRDELRVSDMDEEKARWAHLIPEPEHIRLQRLCEASPDWKPLK